MEIDIKAPVNVAPFSFVAKSEWAKNNWFGKN